MKYSLKFLSNVSIAFIKTNQGCYNAKTYLHPTIPCNKIFHVRLWEAEVSMGAVRISIHSIYFSALEVV